MKNIFVVIAILSASISFGQAYNGADDMKFQIGFNAQSNGTGITGTFDYGISQNLSIGASSAYILGVNELINAPFVDRFDVKVRANANLGDVFQLPDNADVYPGLNLGLKNFGAHLGGRYFFTDGFGVFLELYLPMARYNNDLTPSEKFHNQFAVNIGASFNF